MSVDEIIKRRAFFSFMLAIAGVLLCVYVYSKWLTLSEALKFGSTGWTLLVVSFALGLASAVHLTLAWMLKFRYKSGIYKRSSIVIKILHYDKNQSGNLLVIWHEGGIWATNEMNGP